LTSFPEFFKKRANMCTTSSEENSPNQELIAALIPILNETSQNELALNELLTIFQFQDLAHANGSMDIEQLQEMLDRAIRFDQKEVVERLSRETSFDVAARHGDQGETALHRAAEYDSIHTVGLLISFGLDINATTNSGLTPLHYAAAYASRTETVINLLLEHGVSTTITDIRGRTVLHVAVEFGDVIGLKTLLALDKESSSTLLLPEKSGFIPLFYAAMNRQADTCEYLLSRVENFTDLQPWCPDGLGLVHYAVSMNSLKLLQLVQEKGGRLDQRTADGRNGLHFIPEAVDIRIVDSLLETGLQPTMVADDGATPLHTLIQAGQQLEHKLFDILATQETIQQQDEKGYTVLHCSVSSRPGCCVQKFNYENRNRAFEILVRKGAAVHSKTLEGQSCLQLLFELRQNELKHQKHCCKKAGRSSKAFVDLFTSVITHITDLDILHGCLLAEDGFSFRPINWALSVKEYELANVPYSKGVDIDLQNTGSKQMNRAWSALETAAFHGCSSALFGLLLERSKHRHALDERGFSLVHYVCKEGSGDNFELLEILCGHGFDFNLRSTEDAETPLILATIAGKRAHVQFLLKHGVDYRSRTKYGWEAIHHAVRNENLNIFEEFIGLNMDWEDNCVDVLTQQHLSLPKCNILHLAAICARKDLIYLITEKSLIGDINCWNGSGYSPLHLATCLATFDTVNALLMKGADINLEGPGQIRAIHLAAIHKGLDVINLMLSQNCLLLPDATRMTPEMYALKHGRKDNVDRLRSYAQGKSYNLSTAEVFPFADLLRQISYSSGHVQSMNQANTKSRGANVRECVEGRPYE
jgi:ankyrin repeat protein